MKNNKRLLHLIKSLDVGGIEKTTINYSEKLINNFDLVGIYAHKGFYDTQNTLNKNIKRFIPPFNISNFLFFIVNFFHLIYTIKQNKITHIHYHHRIFIPFLFLLKLFVPQITIIYTHHSVFNDNLNNLIIADKIIVLNEDTKKDLPKKFQSKTTTIPHGITLLDIAVKTTKPKTIGFVGRYVKLKGIHYLLSEFKIVKSYITNVQLYFYGKGPEENKMKEFVKKNSLEDSVFFFEPESDLCSIYKNIDLLVLSSSEIEGFGLVVLEALSFGVPVIVKDLPIYDGLVKNKYNGIVTNAPLSIKIIDLFSNTISFNTMRKNAKKSVLDKFQLQSAIKKYLTLYN